MSLSRRLLPRVNPLIRVLEPHFRALLPNRIVNTPKLIRTQPLFFPEFFVKHSDQADVVESLNKMEQAVREVERIFDFAKTYERLGLEALTDVDVGRAVDEAIDMFSEIPFRIANYCQGLTVVADSFLRQLIYNVLDNTRKYGKKG